MQWNEGFLDRNSFSLIAMESTGDDDSNAVLSDVEGDEDPIPIVLDNLTQEDVSVEKYRELLSELEREKRARDAAENSKSEIQVSFNRLKVLAHEAIKKRDESSRQRDEALREKEEALRLNERISGQLEEALRLKEDVLRERDESIRQCDEMVKAKDSLKSETETAAHMLVTGIEKISAKVSNLKNFSAGGLPKSNKYSGLPAVAYGVIKRTNDIVEELLKQHENVAKSRNAAREQMEQRNYEIAIEVSQLEAAISGLREEVSKKTSEIENLGKLVSEKDEKISSMDKEIVEKQTVAEKEIDELRQLVNDYDQNLRSLESKMDSQRQLVIEQLNYISRIHDQIHNVIRLVDATQSDQSELTDSLLLPQEMDMDKNLRASLDLMESSYQLVKMATEKVRCAMEEKVHEAKVLNETVAQLIKEKQHIGSLLRSALPKTMPLDQSSKMREVLQEAEKGLRELGSDVNFSDLLENGKISASHGKQGLEKLEEGGELYTLAGALETIVKESQLRIIELHHSLEELRTESTLLKAHVEAQAKELTQRRHHIEDLEEKERVANESIEGLMMDIAAAEEEITRWKVAAEQEAAAGGAIEQEFMAKLSAIQQELDEAKETISELEKKLKFKEQTAAAAMAARDAAEKSLAMADSRATRLAERVEELLRQLEESDTREGSRDRTRPRYVCWPWQWLGLNYVGNPREQPQQHGSNEMELSEPLL